VVVLETAMFNAMTDVTANEATPSRAHKAFDIMIADALSAQLSTAAAYKIFRTPLVPCGVRSRGHNFLHSERLEFAEVHRWAELWVEGFSPVLSFYCGPLSGILE
jgi:hypothetical protein